MKVHSSLVSRPPVLEWIAAATGLLFLLFLLGAIGLDVLQGGSRIPPDIHIGVHASVKAGERYLVTFDVRNRGGASAAALEIEGQLTDQGRVIETSSSTIDYVSGHGTAEGGLYFEHDPSSLTLKLRPLGYQAP
ncbi:hypothetical protein C1T17_15795 [Sphingobium sp. SCG-1]|uniref:hypothetical protein n=1 Tax=Sphingobium sp. SCG-1 TaxID=2072936 RepID=UPI000CD6B280|nr:hypothetical protein [Sphingobium sp. SCG-1]AUW59330.1 hypothetical protein C1T17_15795 [Sphingobium sp. SCG-1]